MFDKIKGKMTEYDTTPAQAPRQNPPPPPPAASRPPSYESPSAAATAPNTVTSIGSTMTFVGKISGEGAIQIFGKVEGEISASSIEICANAEVEGTVLAKDLTVGGIMKGTMQAQRVKLLGTANVEGDIFHQSLVIEENARFEGSSKRKENMSERPVAAAPKTAPIAEPKPAQPASVVQMPQASVVPMAQNDANQVRAPQTAPPAQAG